MAPGAVSSSSPAPGQTSGGALGVIAGAGALPQLIAEACRADGRRYVVCAFEGAAPDWIAAHPHAVQPFEKPGALFAALRRAGADRVTFAGGMARPKLRPLAFDLTALRLAPSILPLLKRGDDALLTGLAAVLEREGFTLVAPHDAAMGLLAPAGDMAARRACPEELADVARAAALAAVIGAEDVGQGAVVSGGLCLGLESLQGTDALIDFVGRTPASLRVGGFAPVLFKGPKPGQDWRMDLPAIGPDTLRRAGAAGFAGVAVRAGGVLVLGREATAAAADAAGLFLYGWAP